MRRLYLALILLFAYSSHGYAYSAAKHLIPICISFDTDKK